MSKLGTVTFGWSFPLFRVFGIAVRVHWFFVLWIGMEVMDADKDGIPWQIRLAELGILFGSVLLHEFGHSLACRSVGGKADRILLWPLGGLAECAPPLNPWASLWTTVCGPAVNLVLMAAVVVVLRAHGLEQSAVDAFSIKQGVDSEQVVAFTHSWQVLNPLTAPTIAKLYGPAGHWLGMVYLYNFVLFAFNMACVCYPMDAGRVFQEVMWLFVGYARSLWVAVHVGLAFALAMVVFGLWGGYTSLAVMGFFFMVYGWSTRRQLVMLRAEYGSLRAVPDPRHQAKVGGWLGRLFVKPEDETEVAARLYAAPRPQAQAQAAPDPEEVERILRKIAAEGMAALTDDEKAVLRGGAPE